MDNLLSSEELDRHAAELAEKLGGKVSQETIRQELDKYVYTYKIGIESARSGIMKKYSSPRTTDGVSAAPVIKKIKELNGDEMNVTVTAKMVFVERKTITPKNGTGEKTIVSGIADDGSASAPFTVWSDGEYEKGKVYTFKRAYCKKFRDQVQINIGSRGSVEVSDAQIEGSSWTPQKAQSMKIRDITESTKSASIVGKVLSVEQRFVNLRGEDRTVWGGTISDGTGKIQFSAWEDIGIQEGKVYSIENAGIRTWRGIPQLNISNYTTVSESDAVIDTDGAASTRTVEEISRSGGGIDITLTGTVVDVKSGSGLIKRCPECKRALSPSGECSVHRTVENPVSDLRLKTIVDDGTGAISVIIGRKDTETLTGIDLARAEEMANDLSASAVMDMMATKVLLRTVTVSGNVMIDENYGPQMSARTAKETPTDIEKGADALRAEMEGYL